MDILTSVLAWSFLGISILFLASRVLRNGARKNYPPGPQGIPIFGNMLSIFLFARREQYQIINDWTNKYGPIFCFKIFNRRTHILGDMELAKEAFQQSFDISHRSTFAPADAITGKTNKGLIFSNAAEWREMRRFFVSVFRQNDTSVISFQQLVAEAIESLLLQVEKTHGESVDPAELITLKFANIMTKVITGVTYNEEEIKILVRSTRRTMELMSSSIPIPFLSKLQLPGDLELKAEYRKSYDFMKTAFRHKAATFNIADQPTNFIECILKEKSKKTAKCSWTDQDDVNFEMTTVDTFGAGWTTTAPTVMWVLHNMAAHAEAQELVRDEIRAIVGDGRRPVYADQKNLPVTEATILESMRFTPTIDLQLAHVASRDCKLGGFDISKGDTVKTNAWYLAQSTKIWDRPDEFRPDRFLDSSGALKRDLEPMPFGRGRRACPGEQLARMQLFIFLTYLLQDFKLVLPDGAATSIPGIHSFITEPAPFKIHFIKIR